MFIEKNAKKTPTSERSHIFPAQICDLSEVGLIIIVLSAINMRPLRGRFDNYRVICYKYATSPRSV
jgi:hypothetical protein